jgi:putative phosphoesterase
MILGVVSDTHNCVLHVEEIINIFNTEKVDKVVHTGDITQAKTLEKFSKLKCPLIGVYGNNDLQEEGLKKVAKENNFLMQDPPLILTLNERKLAVLHEPDGIDDLIATDPSIELILHGHTHRYREEQIGRVKVFNPGECAGSISGKNSIGLVNLVNLKIKRIFF